MKKQLLLLSVFLLFVANLAAQQDLPDLMARRPPSPLSGYTIYFNHDTAGNQIKRYFDSSKSSKLEVVVENEAEEIEEEIKNNSQLSYYPNPIENELTITWTKSINSTINVIQIFNTNGKLIKNYNPSKNKREVTLPFQNIASGVYIIHVMFSNGKQDSFKIIKK